LFWQTKILKIASIVLFREFWKVKTKSSANILSCIDTLIIKRPSSMQVEIDRSLLKSYLLKAHKLLEGKSDTSHQTLSYIPFSPSGFEGVVENSKTQLLREV